MDEPRISIGLCRESIGQDLSTSLKDPEVEGLRDMLYAIADVITDAYLDLGKTDQSAFDPPGEVFDYFENQATALERSCEEETRE